LRSVSDSHADNYAMRQESEIRNRRKKQSSSEEGALLGESHDRYLITYADVITLLLCLFVILYATSTVDARKYRQLSTAAREVFMKNVSQVQPSVIGSSSSSTSSGNSSDSAKNYSSALKQTSPFADSSAIASLQSLSQVDSDGKSENAESVNQLANQTMNSLSGELRNGTVSIERTDKGMKLMLAEELLFSSASAELSSNALSTLDRLSAVLSHGNYSITIDGHTDCVPVKSFRYESNWHLSVDRALAVGYLMMQRGVPEHAIAIRGFGSQRPVVDNSTPESRKRNRRVEIFVSSASAKQ
jgi:chemotaxis protein MotB